MAIPIATELNAQELACDSNNERRCEVKLERAGTSQVALLNTEQSGVVSATGRSYRIFVGVPSGPDPDQGWPVTY